MKFKNLYSVILIIFVISINSYCQTNDSRKTFSTVICEYNLPISLDGLSVSAFNVTPRIKIERFEKSAQIVLDIEKIQGTASNPNPSFKHSYNYNGRQYGDQDVGREPFKNISAVRTSIIFEVLVTYGSQSWGWTKVDGMTNQFGPIDKDAKASEVMVNVRIVGIGGFTNTSEIENKIRELSKPQTTGSNPKASNTTNSLTSNTNKQQAASIPNGSNKPTGNAENNASSNNKPVTQTGTTNTGMPANTSGNDPLAHFETDSKTYSNPITTSSSGSSRAENISRSYQQGQQLADATMPVLQGWVDARNARIDREIAQEKSDKDLYWHNSAKYNTQVEDITNYINANYDLYLIKNIPYFFNTVAKPWDNLLGSDFISMFGKSFSELKKTKSFRRAFSNYIKSPEDYHDYSFSLDNTAIAPFNASTPSTIFDMGYMLNGQKIRYQQYTPIFNDDVLIGVKLIPRNNYGQGSAVDYRSDIEGYIKDMKQDLGDNFIMLNGNTYLYKDKLIVFEYTRISMFDTNALKNQLVLLFKDAYYNQKETINVNAVSFGNFGFDCRRGPSYQIVEQIGVPITEITPKGVADKKGLKSGDAIISVNGYPTNYIYQLQLALRTNLKEDKYSVTYLRDNVEYTAELTSNSKPQDIEKKLPAKTRKKNKKK